MLASRLQAAIHVGELANCRASISESGYASFGARVSEHDDLALALAPALWWLTGDAAHNACTLEPLPCG